MALFQASTVDGSGPERRGVDRIGLEMKGFPSCVHSGKERTGVESSGLDGTGKAIFHASTLEWSGEERTGEDWMGGDWNGVLLGVHNVKYGTGQERIVVDRR